MILLVKVADFILTDFVTYVSGLQVSVLMKGKGTPFYVLVRYVNPYMTHNRVYLKYILTALKE